MILEVLEITIEGDLDKSEKNHVYLSPAWRMLNRGV